MSQPFAVFDIDGTLIRWQLYHAITDMLAKQHLLDNKIYDELKLARMDWKRRSGPDAFKAYERRVVEAYEKAITKITFDQFELAAKAVFEEYKDQVYRYTRDLIESLKQQGYMIFAISGSQTEIVKLMADYYGFDDFIGSTYERAGDQFTGKVTVHAGTKHLILDEMVKKHGLDYERSVAVGDSEGDVSMLESVEKPIAFNPTQKLFEIAQANGWKIVVERKNVIYQLDQEHGRYVLAQTN